MRGVDRQGQRFVDELQRRDVVSGAIMRQGGRHIFLVLGKKAAEDFGIGPLKFYESRGLVKEVRPDQLSCVLSPDPRFMPCP